MNSSAIMLKIRPESSSAVPQELRDQHYELPDWIEDAFDFKWTLVSNPQSTCYVPSFDSDLVNWFSVRGPVERQKLDFDWVQLIAASLDVWETNWKITHELLGQALPILDRSSRLADAPAGVEVKDRKVISVFAHIAEVQSVFRDRVRDGLVYWIFTANSEYDSGLMDELIFRELRVIDTFGDEGISFRFVPSIASATRREVVGEHATLIFEK